MIKIFWQNPAIFRRAEFLSARDLIQRATGIGVLFLAAHLAGWREFTSTLNGTVGSTAVNVRLGTFLAAFYILLYLAFVILVPVLVLAASVFAADQLYESKSPRWSWRQVPAPQLFTTTSTGGVTMRVPAEGDQCWDAAIPCTPEPPATLQRSTLLGHVMYSR